MATIAGTKVYQRPLAPKQKGTFVRTNERKDNWGKMVCWENDTYAVAVSEAFEGGGHHMTVQRKVQQPARDWRDLQHIKNVMFGEEREAVEIFPPESMLIDCSNTTWLWVMPEGKIMPCGLRHGRHVED